MVRPQEMRTVVGISPQRRFEPVFKILLIGTERHNKTGKCAHKDGYQQDDTAEENHFVAAHFAENITSLYHTESLDL
jgi:hypothetical protein